MQLYHVHCSLWVKITLEIWKESAFIFRVCMCVANRYENIVKLLEWVASEWDRRIFGLIIMYDIPFNCGVEWQLFFLQYYLMMMVIHNWNVTTINKRKKTLLKIISRRLDFFCFLFLPSVLDVVVDQAFIHKNPKRINCFNL